MSTSAKAEKYRERAAQYVERARASTDDRDRMLLLEMAEMWFALALKEEGVISVPIVIPHNPESVRD